MTPTAKGRMKSGLPLVALSLVASLFLARPANAETFFGIRGGSYTDADEPFLGLELLSQVRNTNWYLNPNFEYVFVNNGDLFTLNLDVHYDFIRQPRFDVWAGGGPALVFRDPPGRRRGSQTDLGVNLLAGAGFPVEGFVPYVQGKILLSDENEGVIAVGLRF